MSLEKRMVIDKSDSISGIPIGIFDSGVGGLSVLRAIHELLPTQTTIYLADQAHVPYGSRSLDEVRAYSESITRYLVDKGTKLIVIACNTASAAALQHLRQLLPDIPFVGMEPAVKPAAENTITGVVGVLATPATFQGALYSSVVERFAKDVKILQDTCPGLVEQIENGKLDDPVTRSILHKAIDPMLDQNIDTIVMGCTHYPFVIPIIEEITGGKVRVIDPAPAVAKQTARLLTEHGWLTPDTNRPQHHYFTTGSAQSMRNQIMEMCGKTVETHQIQWGKDIGS